MSAPSLVLIGRSSSHFTRVTRMFAEEFAIGCRFEPVPDLASLSPAHYGGNPALRLPILVTDAGHWFGTANICRELSRQASARPLRVVWPEEHREPLLCNALELTLQGMATEVSLIMQTLSNAPETPATSKLRASLELSVAWLDQHVASAIECLPVDRDASLFEVALYCFTTHLTFRNIFSMSQFSELARFCTAYSGRPAALRTEYRFDR